MTNRFESETFRCEPPGGLDDATLAYIEAAESCFEDLRQVAAQLAGLLLLAASGARSAGPHHPMLAVAADLFDSARDATLRLTPRSSLARHHHRHLRIAAENLAKTLDLLRVTPADRQAVAAPTQRLTSAWQELGHASRALPGFDLVDFSQSCCAEHRPAGRLAL
ncbi:hypothetical protein OSH10_20345 [Kaistia defluvii]|uniref:hypothetical protein n=1 Tax=Kaistia defluvii TaxID=410841 RepID=UPI0022512703|nr:hypothetical protein [Kaistia defluvii]MCX5520795.1 hypothetical protein [Kaistia defluvii]